MRRNLLSFSVGLFLIGCVFTAHSELAMRGLYGSAYAAGWGQAGRHITAAERKVLLRSISFNTDTLLKVTGQQVRVVFQQPELVRTDLPTVVWQYRNDECVLDVYFASADTDVSGAPVVHYEVRARSFAGPETTERQADCIQDLIAERSQRPAMDVSVIYKS
jgi:hypothetical protein